MKAGLNVSLDAAKALENAMRKSGVVFDAEKFNVTGPQRAVQTVGAIIAEAADPLSMANSVIKELGGKEITNFPDARITAKAMVEQKTIKGVSFDPVAAAKYAVEKVAKLRVSQPEAFITPEVASDLVKKRGRPGTKTSDGGSLKAKALEICNTNAGLTTAQLAGKIQKDLSISYSNAYYYASRVYKR